MGLVTTLLGNDRMFTPLVVNPNMVLKNIHEQSTTISLGFFARVAAQFRFWRLTPDFDS